MKKTDAYPCVVRYEDNTYYADFPDFDACFTDADSLGELFVNTKEVLNGVLFTMLDNGLALPKTSDGKSINLKKGEFVLLVLSLIHISEPTRRLRGSRMPSSA